MAVVDPTPRPHHLRDIVFAVASLTLLGGVLWFGAARLQPGLEAGAASVP